MTDSLIAPTPERAQHDDIVAQPAGRNNKARIYVKPIHDRWYERNIITAAQHQAAQRFIEDHEQLQRGLKSCLAVLDRVDAAAAPNIVPEAMRHSGERITALCRSLGPSGYALLYRILVEHVSLRNIKGNHQQVTQGMVIMALEVTAQVYGIGPKL